MFKLYAEGKMLATNKSYDGYWNIADDPSDPGCYLISGDKVTFIQEDGVPGSTGVTIESARQKIEEGKYVVSRWMPPGICHNPAHTSRLTPAAEPAPLTVIDDEEAARRFIMLQAIKVVETITLELTAAATEAVRRVYPRPSLIDRAIAARVAELLA